MERNKKNILVVSRFFYPNNGPRAFRTTELVKEFAKEGHKVTLLTIKNERYHIQFEEEYNVEVKDLGTLRLPKIKIPENNLLQYPARIFKTIFLQLFEYPDIELMFKVRNKLIKEQGYDMLISIAAPHAIHWGTAWAFQRNNSISDTWIADCGDPYSRSELGRFNKASYLTKLEKFFCKNADYISVPFEAAKEGYHPEFRDKIKVVPQGFNFSEVNVDSSIDKKNKYPVFAYAGSLMRRKRDPRTFLKFILSLDRQFKFIIYTKNKGLVSSLSEQDKKRIEIRDYIPRKKLLKELCKMDFLVNFENKTSCQKPSKLIDYYLTKQPVLSVKGWSLDRRKIIQFLEGDYSQKVEFNNMDRHKIENICHSFLEFS